VSILKPKNAQDLPIGTPVCVITEEEDDVAAFANYQVAEDVSHGSTTGRELPAAAAVPAPTPATAATADPVDSALGDFVLIPSARCLSQSKGTTVTSTSFHSKPTTRDPNARI
jgi:pyruvate/2-oxoglutarate dehydrogenase complex dihydrolipoamide acyltransferase (E2) component